MATSLQQMTVWYGPHGYYGIMFPASDGKCNTYTLSLTSNRHTLKPGLSHQRPTTSRRSNSNNRRSRQGPRGAAATRASGTQGASRADGSGQGRQRERRGKQAPSK